MRAKLDEQTFMSELERIGPAELGRKYNIAQRSVYSRRAAIEKRHGTTLIAPRAAIMAARTKYPHRVNLDVLNGIVLVGSDAHIWPGAPTTALRAFVKFAREMKPRAVIMNGDVMDFPQISRHDPIGWEDHPTVAKELEAAQIILRQIEEAAPHAKLVWTFGNHDSRLETRIASQLPELAKVKGVHLKDHFGDRWQPCWSAFINESVVVKHRFKGGMNATRANTLNSGLSMVTGHLHSANVRGLTDYNGTRWGVDTGCLAEPAAQAFVNYTEDNPLDWRSGFAVLTFKDGVLLQPELCLTFSRDVVQFRGELINVGGHQCTSPIRPARATAGRRAGSSRGKTPATIRRTTSVKIRSTGRGKRKANEAVRG